MKAMILAAGFGKRLLPLTAHTPKPLLTIANKPLIVYHIENLLSAGIDDILINLHHLGSQIKDYLGDGKQFGAKIRYSEEHDILETGGGVLNALPLLGNDPFIIINADIFTDFNPALLLERAKNFSNLAHLILIPNPPQHPLGDYAIDPTGLVTTDNFPTYTYSGIALLTPKLFENKKIEKFRLPECYTSAMEKQLLSGEIYHGIWHDVGTIDRLEQLNCEVRTSAP